MSEEWQLTWLKKEIGRRERGGGREKKRIERERERERARNEIERYIDYECW